MGTIDYDKTSGSRIVKVSTRGFSDKILDESGYFTYKIKYVFYNEKTKKHSVRTFNKMIYGESEYEARQKFHGETDKMVLEMKLGKIEAE